MTSTQERMINRIRREAETMHGKYSDKYEIKAFEVNDNGYSVGLFVEVGLIGDEGTAAQYLARDSVHVFIGPRGGTKIPCYKARKDGSFHNYYKSYRDIWQATLDYKAH